MEYYIPFHSQLDIILSLTVLALVAAAKDSGNFSKEQDHSTTPQVARHDEDINLFADNEDNKEKNQGRTKCR